MGDYVHVVSDGLKGFVYRAIIEEAETFARKLISSVKYTISPISEGASGEFWDFEFDIVPSDTSMCEGLCRDFVRHMQEVSGKQFSVKGSPCYQDMYHPSVKFELYGVSFNPDARTDGVHIMTGRSAHKFADKETTRQWFQRFVDKVQSPNYNPTS